MTVNRALAAALLLTASVIGLWLAVVVAPPAKPTYLMSYPEPRAIAPFTLETVSGEVTEAALQGQWTLVFLGYTYCPDICPTTMANLQGISDALPENVKIWFVSVDPKRDSAERVSEYSAYFGERITGLRAEHPALFPFVRNLGLVYALPEGTDQEGYMVDHSGSVVLVNPQGQLVGRFTPSSSQGLHVVNPQHILEDVTLLATHSG